MDVRFKRRSGTRFRVGECGFGRSFWASFRLGTGIPMENASRDPDFHRRADIVRRVIRHRPGTGASPSQQRNRRQGTRVCSLRPRTIKSQIKPSFSTSQFNPFFLDRDKARPKRTWGRVSSVSVLSLHGPVIIEFISFFFSVF